MSKYDSTNELYNRLRQASEGDELIVMFRDQRYYIKSVSSQAHSCGSETILWIEPYEGE